ncbi:MAG: GNAT family N-acetyltransferase [Elusimicrobiota bacterium]
MPNIPAVETKRLTLRPHKLEDFAACAAMWADPVVTRHIGGVPSTAQQAWARMTGYLGHWSLMGFGYWALEEKATGRYVGELGFADFKRELEPSIAGIPELGWALVPDVHGRGYATEAVRAAASWGDGRFGRTVCLISPANIASIRVAEKCGFRRLRETAYKGETVFLFERTGAVPK